MKYFAVECKKEKHIIDGCLNFLLDSYTRHCKEIELPIFKSLQTARITKAYYCCESFTLNHMSNEFPYTEFLRAVSKDKAINTQ